MMARWLRPGRGGGGGRGQAPALARLLYIAVSVLGLAPALCLGGICAAYVMHELHFDPTVPSPGEVYAVVSDITGPGNPTFSTVNAPIQLRAEIEARLDPAPAAARGCEGAEVIVAEGQERSPAGERSLLFVDPRFGEIVALPLINGSRMGVLSPGEALVSADLARQLFGNAQAIGNTILVGREPAVVAGVLAPTPANTRFHPDAVLSTDHAASPTHRFEAAPRWVNFLCPLWVRADATAATGLQAWLDGLVAEKYAAEAAAGERFRLRLVDIRTLRQSPDIVQSTPGHDPAGLLLLAATAALAACIALANYFALTAARAAGKVRAVAVHRVLGAGRAALACALLAEPLAVVAAAVLVAGTLAYPALGFAQGEAGADLLGAPGAGLAGALAALSVALASLAAALGASWWVARVPLADAVRGATRAGGRLGRGWPVALQFSAAMLAVTLTLVAWRQADYAMSRGTEGLEAARIAIVSGVRALGPGPERQRLVDRVNALGLPLDAVGSSHVPGDPAGSFVTSSRFRTDGVPASLSVVRADPGFFAAFGVAPLAGRLYDSRPAVRPADGSQPLRQVVLDISALAVLGIGAPAEAVGKVIGGPDQDLWAEVVGVVPDLGHYGARERQPPTVFFADPNWTSKVTLRLGAVDAGAMLRAVEGVWQDLSGGRPLSVEFLDARMRRVNASIRLEARLLSALGAVSALLSCMGLVAMAVHRAERSARAMGVRKVFGASALDLGLAQYASLGRPLLLGLALAVPPAEVAADWWLSKFPAHVEVGVGPYLAAAALLVAVAALSVLPAVAHASRLHPVVLLRSTE